MKTKQKIKSFFDSLWFNVVMSIVAVVILGEKIVLGYQSGSYQYIMIAIWIVITYHFIREVIKAKKRR